MYPIRIRSPKLEFHTVEILEELHNADYFKILKLANNNERLDNSVSVVR